MATKPENVNPFAKYVEQPAEAPPENPFAKYLQISQLEEATKKYEEEVPFVQRVTDPLQAGIAKIPGIRIPPLPALPAVGYLFVLNAVCACVPYCTIPLP